MYHTCVLGDDQNSWDSLLLGTLRFGKKRVRPNLLEDAVGRCALHPTLCWGRTDVWKGFGMRGETATLERVQGGSLSGELELCE